MPIEMSQNVHQSCFEIAEEMRQLLEKFQRRCLQLMVQHCENHIQYRAPNESQSFEAHSSSIRDRKSDQIPQSPKSLPPLKCPKCPFVSERRNNLERHWPSHIPCNEICKFCKRSLGHVQHYIYHYRSCTVKEQFSAESTEQVETLQQLNKFQEIAAITLDESLQSSESQRKRKRRALGSVSKKVRRGEWEVKSTSSTGHNLNMDSSIVNSTPTIEHQVQPSQSQASGAQGISGRIGDSKSIESDIYEVPQIEGNIDPTSSEQPTHTTACTYYPALLSRDPPLAASCTTTSVTIPNVPEEPAFATSYTIDGFIVPEQPAFAACYTIDQSFQPQYSIYEDSYTPVSQLYHPSTTSRTGVGEHPPHGSIPY
ncbi:hypothetical protein F4678DRAFT_413191 [Xylaria arbuscula]|nr:hypothetical protein F4678DRAFT_413191 [Xylaria arbuscula]